MLKSKPLKNMRALVTGASSGIGFAYAEALAAAGADVLIAARRLSRLEDHAERLSKKYSVNVSSIKCDLLSREALKSLYEQSIAGGNIQVLINNAGIGGFAPFGSRDVQRDLDTIQLNIAALTELTYLFVGHMKNHGEKSYIQNVGSIAGFQALPYFAVYSGSKFYVKAFSESLGYELRDSNISVSCLCPGGTSTEFLDRAGQKMKKENSNVMMTSGEVARIGLQGLLAEKTFIVPGFMNKVASLIPRFVSSSLALSLTSKAMSANVDMVEPIDPEK